MITTDDYACERIRGLEATLVLGADDEIEQALQDLGDEARRVWARKPTTLTDIADRALIARAYMDRDEAGRPVADCALSRATLELIDAVLRIARV